MQTSPSRTAHWQSLDVHHHMHPFTDHVELANEKPMVIERAEGVYIYDSEGRQLLDGMAGLWCVNVGYGREEIVDAVARQMRQLPFYNTFFKTTTPAALELAHKLSTLTPEGIDYFFFSNSGSEANDTNIRLAQSYWQLLGRPERKVIISRNNAYHGSTIAAASLTGMASMHDIPACPIDGIVHIANPDWYACAQDMTEDEYGLQTAQALEAKVLELGAENIAAFFAEPIQGAGGVIVAPKTYWPEIQRICRKYDILLVVDEVITGFGRTGAWFGAQTFGIQPDLMTLAKGLSSGYLPISASGVSERVAKVLRSKPGRFPHGYTYSGHPAAAAAALKNIEIMERERLVQQVGERTGPCFQNALARLLDHPMVGHVRGHGLMACVVFSPDKTRRAAFNPLGGFATKVRNHCFANGLVTRAVGDGLVFAPPLVITEAQIGELVHKLRKSLDEVLAQGV
ncbi:aspartate aminotransferase family protein [Verminephrobacter aporrectodeae subsp. tuberculatae]|uniref:aspartate aminotransferase family protein n=1 Tax=Verminephrobacter aporrectodeae TaxID=1110389 RepID=UPI0022448DF7|nr:aspartate aminotransferase family protein [Verminephrobacter aporrectodeae]MCW8163388.1 aspartate aminotransferase family protein [Verminephrobacter aporrectodeae subsp. tuberculatae]MCW8167617.1 aspartate aminotransferase family protein [Verminephrobacter aporrectodeae subsp. tuberculatae]